MTLEKAFEELEVIIDTGGIPFSPRVKSDDGKEYLDCPRVVTDLVYDKAASWYGDPLPHNIEERIAMELYGNIVYKVCYENVKKENKNLLEKQTKYEEYFTSLDSLFLIDLQIKNILGLFLEEDTSKINAILEKTRLNPTKSVKNEIDFAVGKKQLSQIIEKCIDVHGITDTA